jgi:hypothetical protein
MVMVSSTHFDKRLYPAFDEADKVSIRPDFALVPLGNPHVRKGWTCVRPPPHSGARNVVASVGGGVAEIDRHDWEVRLGRETTTEMFTMMVQRVVCK